MKGLLEILKNSLGISIPRANGCLLLRFAWSGRWIRNTPSGRIPRILGHELYLFRRMLGILRLGAAGDRAQHIVFHRSKRQVADGPEYPSDFLGEPWFLLGKKSWDTFGIH